MQVDDGQVTFVCHFADAWDDAVHDGTVVDAPVFPVGWNGQAQVDARMRGECFEGIYHRVQVFLEVFLVYPVYWF